MSKVWVLDTETKGTGANMVPLERTRKRSAVWEPVLVPREPPARPEPAPEPRPPRRFRIVDVMTRQTLADDVSTRGAADVLRGVRSIIDVNVYIWQEPQARWQMLPFSDMRAIWDLAHADRSGELAQSASR
jgi:hypothetical protein